MKACSWARLVLGSVVNGGGGGGGGSAAADSAKTREAMPRRKKDRAKAKERVKIEPR